SAVRCSRSAMLAARCAVARSRRSRSTASTPTAARAAALAGEQSRLTAARAAVGVEAVLRLRRERATAHRAASIAEREHRTALAALEAARPLTEDADPAGVAPPAPFLPTARRATGTDTDRPEPTVADGHERPAVEAAATAPGRSTTAVTQQSRALAGAGVAELAAAERRLRERCGRLDAARADEQRHQRLGHEQEELAAERVRAEELAEEAQDWLIDYDTRLKALQDAQETARTAEARVEQLDARRAELSERVAAATRRDGLHRRIAEAERAALDLRGAAQDARAHTLDLQERRLAGMAAELAEQLADGLACRVCGSAEHPVPAVPTADRVTAGDEERARAAQRAAEERSGAAETSLTALRIEEAAAASAAGGRAVAELTAALAEVDAERRSALHAADGLGLLGQRIEQLERERRDRQERLQQAGERGAALTARLQRLDADRRELAGRIAAARGDAPSVAARLAELGRLTEAVAATLAAAQGCSDAAGLLAEAEREVERAARAAGFADSTEAEAAVLPAVEREALSARLERVHTALARAESLLAEPELAEAAARPAADPGAARSEEALATDRLRRASAVERAAVERGAALARIGGALTALARQLAPALERFGRISRLAALLAGAPAENALRMRLESYVLAARLEQVAAAASDRLIRMSGGRYTLVHSDGLVSGTKRSGLSLRVVDAWTGSERDTATLSGGESFFASLALALGLADVVTDEAGGMPLDTLFIDEGFGSLDEHTLEEVMDVLDGLRERDRAVGIVSHVADLRSRIPAQLLVRKHRHGSTLRLAAREDA
ncbi:SbcC/MukB-like Walker B domain-containing protein, partial [Kitasatospora cinereorecta]